MNRFVKNNLKLMILLGTAAVIVIALAVFAVLQHTTMSSYIVQLESLKNNIAQLIRQKPAPVEGNLPRMQRDADFYRRKAAEYQIVFGQPYRPALKQFVAALTDVKELTADPKMSEDQRLEKFMQIFKSFWAEQKSRRTLQDQIYQQFKLARVKSANWNKALNAFAREAQKYTLEPIDDGNKDDVFLQVMGVPRLMGGSVINCELYRKILRSKLIDYFGNKGVGFGDKASNFGFDEKIQPGDIPAIAVKWEIVGDLGRRIADSGVGMLDELVQQSPPTGKKQGAYINHRFKIVVRGELAKIRGLIRGLNEAVKDRRFYYIRYVLLNKEEDAAVAMLQQAAELRAAEVRRELDAHEGGEGKTVAAPVAVPEVKRTGKLSDEEIRKLQEATEKARLTAMQERERNLPFQERSGYGRVLVGANRFVRAVIVVDYIVYSAE